MMLALLLLALQIQTREIREQTPAQFEITFQYPEIANAKPFNDAVHGIVNPVVEKFKKEVRIPGTPNFPGYLNGKYTAETLNNDVVSVLLEWTIYTPGAAHPYGEMASVDYDARSNRVLTLSDLFRPGADYVPRLSQLAIASLEKNEFMDPGMVRRGAGPVESNFKVFTLTNAALVLHFPTYQVAPGVAGPQRVVIPLETLAPLLRKRDGF
jgi:hypothetical protein